MARAGRSYPSRRNPLPLWAWQLTRTATHFQFRNDDGSETTATYIGSQDGNVTMPSNANHRLRLQTDTMGNAGSEGLKLQYREVGTTTFKDVPADWSHR